MPRRLKHNKLIETDITDPDTGKAVILSLNPPLTTLGFREKQSKTTVTIPLMDCYMAAKNARGEDYKAIVTRVKKKPQLDITDEIRGMLHEHRRLHLAQIRQSLEKKGIGISRKVAGSLMSLMEQTGEVARESGMYYHLTEGTIAKVG